jgi:hypothetical protein
MLTEPSGSVASLGAAPPSSPAGPESVTPPEDPPDELDDPPEDPDPPDDPEEDPEEDPDDAPLDDPDADPDDPPEELPPLEPEPASPALEDDAQPAAQRTSSARAATMRGESRLCPIERPSDVTRGCAMPGRPFKRRAMAIWPGARPRAARAPFCACVRSMRMRSFGPHSLAQGKGAGGLGSSSLQQTIQRADDTGPAPR